MQPELFNPLTFVCIIACALFTCFIAPECDDLSSSKAHFTYGVSSPDKHIMLNAKAYGDSKFRPNTKYSSYAYITILWGDNPPIDNVLTLGKSLDGHCMVRRKVVYLSSGWVIDTTQKEVLRKAGWEIQEPNTSFKCGPKLKKRLCGNMMKYLLFDVDPYHVKGYEKAIYLDSDLIVRQNIDHLFTDEMCAGDICFAETHSDMLQAGVLVFRPNSTFSKEMFKFAEDRKSYNGGEQGILHAKLNDRYLTGKQIVNFRHGVEDYPVVQQISAKYNSNPMYSYVFNGWQYNVDPFDKDPYILHYPYLSDWFPWAKPWNPWFMDLLSMNKIWWYNYNTICSQVRCFQRLYTSVFVIMFFTLVFSLCVAFVVLYVFSRLVRQCLGLYPKQKFPALCSLTEAIYLKEHVIFFGFKVMCMCFCYGSLDYAPPCLVRTLYVFYDSIYVIASLYIATYSTKDDANGKSYRIEDPNFYYLFYSFIYTFAMAMWNLTFQNIAKGTSILVPLIFYVVGYYYILYVKGFFPRVRNDILEKADKLNVNQLMNGINNSNNGDIEYPSSSSDNK